jgi:hypothetical protein
MFFDGEHASPTDHPKVLRARNVALNDTAMRAVDALLDAAALGVSEPELRALLRCIVPDFVSPDHRAEEPHPVAAPAGAYGAPTLAPTASRLQLTGTGGSS